MKMDNPELIPTLTDAELSHEMTETRRALESIRPYRYREMEKYRELLRHEYNKRNPPIGKVVCRGL